MLNEVEPFKDGGHDVSEVDLVTPVQLKKKVKIKENGLRSNIQKNIPRHPKLKYFFRKFGVDPSDILT